LSIIRTSFFSYSYFFLLLVEVELLLNKKGVEVEGSNKKGRGDKEGKGDKEKRSFFSLFI